MVGGMVGVGHYVSVIERCLERRKVIRKCTVQKI